MLELSAYIGHTKQRKKPDISLSGWLEAFVGHYYVSGEGGGNRDFHWLAVYCDPAVDDLTEAVETTPANLTACVSSGYEWAFVLEARLQTFREHTADYGMVYIPLASFKQELLQCACPETLPEPFSRLLWIDDGFLDDETLPFDFHLFSLIDEGVPYLNPRHFSAARLMELTGGGGSWFVRHS
jgi:hypothetical protein